MLNLDEETPVVDPLVDAKFGPLNPDFIPALAAIRGGDSLAEFLAPKVISLTIAPEGNQTLSIDVAGV